MYTVWVTALTAHMHAVCVTYMLIHMVLHIMLLYSIHIMISTPTWEHTGVRYKQQLHSGDRLAIMIYVSLS